MWTPIGSRFSIEQTTTQLSARSRITSSSNSFHPTIERSMRISLIGLAASPLAAMARNSSIVPAMPVPWPPRMNAGRTITGSPTLSTTHIASSSEWAVPGRRHLRPISCMADLNCCRSSAVRMASALAPISLGRAGMPDGLALVQLHRQVECGLAAESRQDGIGPFALDDLLEDVGLERLDIGGVGELGVGHDRRRVGVGEDPPGSPRPAAPGRPGCRSSRTRRPDRSRWDRNR